jgi:hypothetical protein
MFVPAMVPAAEMVGSDVALEKYLRRQRTLRVSIANLLPLLLIVMSVASFICYQMTRDQVIADRIKPTKTKTESISVKEVPPINVTEVPPLTVKEILQREGTYYPIANNGALQGYYLGIFLFAEAAFVVMALREYAYGVLKISEASVLGEKALAGYMSESSRDALPM